MPSAKDPEIMVEPDPPREGYASEILGGYRNDRFLQASFPNSPIQWSTNADVILTDEELTDGFINLLNTSITHGFQFPNTVYMDYHMNRPPHMGSVKTGVDKSGNPSMGETFDGQDWPVPNPESSTGPGNASGGHSVGANYIDQDEYDGPPVKQTSVNYGSGPPSPLSPDVTSKEIAVQNFTELTLGKSSVTRIGAYSESSE